MSASREWYPISNHALLLLYVTDKPQTTYRELAGLLGMTERNVVRVVRDLQADGILSYTRAPEGNVYKIRMNATLPRGALAGQRVGRVIEALRPLVK